jgi:16S rRNA (adenine1518-N6/adenine1519-N6)-dimethyltransferase
VGQRLGQHFLVKGSILERIAAAACPEGTDLVIEIGPGRGALTEKLLKRARRVVAIDLDFALAEHLRSRFSGDGRLQVIQGDVLATDLSQWGPVPIVGNLPYYITSPILEKTGRLRFPRSVFLMQKEVAERLVATPGHREYGFLTVQTALFATPRILFEVGPSAFHPPPKVDSAVVLLEPRAFDIGDVDGFLRFVAHCFRHKRKTIRNNLAGHYVTEGWPEAGLRGEQIPLEQFADMYRRAQAQ